jgi:hypothetical protein
MGQVAPITAAHIMKLAKVGTLLRHSCWYMKLCAILKQMSKIVQDAVLSSLFALTVSTFPILSGF